MNIFYKRLKDNIPKRGAFLSLTFLILLSFQPSSLLAIVEEDELTECLKKRLTPFENPLDQERNETQIQTLYKSVREYYEPLATQDPEATITLGFYRSLVKDGKKGLSYILSFANRGNAQAQYLTGFFLCYLKRKPEAMRALADAALQGHQKALDYLKTHAYQLNDSYALLELSRFFYCKKEKAAEAQCLEQMIDDLVLLLPRLLIQGYIQFLHNNVAEALQFYREAAFAEPERAQPYVDHLFRDPIASFHLLKTNAFQEGELEQCQEVLITSLSKNEEQLTELSVLASENPDAAYIYGCALLERYKASKNKKEDLLLSVDPLFFAARANHRLAEQKLKQIVDQHKTPELLYSYGHFLLERGEHIEGENYLRQAMKNNSKLPMLTFQPVEEKKNPPISPPQPLQKPSPSPTKPKVKPDWLQIGCQLEGSNKWEQAIEAFKKVSSSQRLEAVYHLGRLYYKLYKKNKETQPEEALLQAIKAHEFLDLFGDQHSDALYTLGKLFYLEQEVEKAEEKWEAALKLGYSASLYRLGILYAERKENMARVRACFREAGKQEIPKAWHRAAWLSSAMGDTRGEAQDLYHGAMENYLPCLISLISLANKTSPASIPALFNLGTYYFSKQQYAEARVCWDKVKVSSLQDDPEYARRLPYNYAQLALQEDKIEEAIKLFTDSANTGLGLAYAALGKIFWKNKKEPKIALDFYNKALEMEAKNGEILYDLAAIHYSLGNMDEAVLKAAEANLYGEEDALSLLKEIYQKARHPLAAFTLARLSLQNNETSDAKTYWTVALESLDVQIKNAAHFSLCMTTFSEGDLAETVKLAQKAIQDGETRFVGYLQTFAHSEDLSPGEKEKKVCARKVLKKLGISLKKPAHSDSLNKESS